MIHRAANFVGILTCVTTGELVAYLKVGNHHKDVIACIAILAVCAVAWMALTWRDET